MSTIKKAEREVDELLVLQRQRQEEVGRLDRERQTVQARLVEIESRIKSAQSESARLAEEVSKTASEIEKLQIRVKEKKSVVASLQDTLEKEIRRVQLICPDKGENP